jgi:hypothetical protein
VTLCVPTSITVMHQHLSVEWMKIKEEVSNVTSSKVQ